NPKEFSMLELPRNEIKHIRKWMDGFSFPNHTANEKHNLQCFNDYKIYLDAYLNNENEARYHDYQFVPEWVGETDKKIKEEDSLIRVEPNMTKAMFIAQCELLL